MVKVYDLKVGMVIKANTWICKILDIKEDISFIRVGFCMGKYPDRENPEWGEREETSNRNDPNVTFCGGEIVNKRKKLLVRDIL